jgi:predicted Zn-dependent peptidase
VLQSSWWVRNLQFLDFYVLTFCWKLCCNGMSTNSLPSITPEAAKASVASVTTLASGLVVVTENAASTSTVTMTYPKAGSASESIDEQGAALINKCLAFNTGSGLSTVMINRTIENEGAIPFAEAGRTSSTLGYTVEPDNAVGLVPLLATDCTFEKWDVRDAKQLAAYQTAEANKSAQILLTEQIYAAAYGAQSSMGRPYYSADASTYEIASFRSRGYGSNGAILAATGIKDHGAFCAEVESMLSESSAGTSDAAPASAYIGGEARLAAPSAGFAHVALTFEASVPAAMRSVLKACFSIVGKESGVSGFETTGLVGVYAAAPSAGVGALDSAMTDTLLTKISADVVSKAKTLAKAEALFALDCGSKGLAAAMTASIMESGSFSSAAGLASEYDAITEKDVSGALATILKSNPSIAAVGDISVFPYQGTFASRF